MYPLDVVKTRAQLHVGAGTSMFGALVHMVKNEGYEERGRERGREGRERAEEEGV